MRRLPLILLFLALATPARAQYLTRPALEWRTVKTARFDVHYPADMEAWVLPVARRLDAMATAVDALVGSDPGRRTTVMVEDPSSVANGFALPMLRAPLVFLWPTPPTPSPSFGIYRNWGEVLAVHEYGHIAHLTIPTRHPGERLLWRVLPEGVGPVARKAPAWVTEGYATYVEGQLTGNGRPFSAQRAALVRQWAVEGRLPSYYALDATSPFLGGAMRYHVGSAYLEWLVARKGEQSLRDLWRRMSARERRSFDVAFQGVYGAPPADLYGRFVAEMTAEAVAIERELRARAGGLVEGTLVQKRRWSTGESAVSADGTLLAVPLRSPTQPGRIVIWRTAPDTAADSARARAERAMLARDPLDVPAIDSLPLPRRAIATLGPVGFRSHDNPRFFRDGERLLVSRDEPLGDGATRPDLFEWNFRRDVLRRVTHGAGIRQGDPAPDGKRAAARRCMNGICDLVLVDLASGEVRLLAPGSPSRVWDGPRWSPDGSRLAASLHEGGHWRVVVVDPETGASREVATRDSASRFMPDWLDASTLVVTSEASGIANLERIDVASGRLTQMTRTAGAFYAPTASASAKRVWFLSLHATGLDIREIGADASVGEPERVPGTAGLAVVARLPEPRDTFAVRGASPPSDYGLGPRRWRVLPGAIAGPDGAMVSLMVANLDPVGRLGTVLQGGIGEPGAWRGASLGAAWRAWPVRVEGTAFAVEQEPSRQGQSPFAPRTLDASLAGGMLSFAADRQMVSWGWSARAGGAVMGFDQPAVERDTRTVGFGEGSGVWSTGSSQRYVSIGGRLHGALGTTAGVSWRRVLATTTLQGRAFGQWLRADASWGTIDGSGDAASGGAGAIAVDDDGTPLYEHFTVGGAAPPFTDRALLSQRLALPAVPVGIATGRTMATYRLTTELMGVRPYAVWASAGERLDDYHRVFGAELELDLPSYAFARLPAVRLLGGVGYSVDEPFRGRMRVYAGVTYRP